MTAPDTEINPEITGELSALLGIEGGYFDNWGRRREATPEAIASIMRSMGVLEPPAALDELKGRPWNRFIEPALVVSVNDQPTAIPVYFPLEEGRGAEAVLSWQVEDEGGNREEGELRGVSPAESATLNGVRYVRADLPNSAKREIGYYTVRAKCSTPGGKYSGTMRLIVAPDKCHMPEGRSWGLSLNLYAMRSERNWGVGDLGDLRETTRWAAESLGCDFVGINPLHATPNREPYGVSPYSSLSRLYRNVIYVDIDRALKDVPEAERLHGDPAISASLARLRGLDFIDYEACAALKKEALGAAFAAFKRAHTEKGSALAGDFRRYVDEEGPLLDDFAAFMALDERLREEYPTLYRWQDWPEEYRSPRSPAVEAFKREHSDAVTFYKYVQWLIDRQLGEAAEAGGGMEVGIYQDLAVGSSGEGSDAWSHPEVFALGASAGAPPDAFNLRGQDWGFPPVDPHRLRESGYELFIQTIRKNLRHAGALRIDHALGLFRLFFVPEGMSPAEGTYVRQPAEDLLRIIALESVRNRAVIIAEDLGNVTDEAREALHRFGMLSFRLFYFERDWKTTPPPFLPPGKYPEAAFAAVTTHDLPTIWGYWSGHDIEARLALGLYPDEEAEKRDAEERGRDRQLMLDALRDFLPEGYPDYAVKMPVMTWELVRAVHAFLASTPCLLVSASMDDVLGVFDQQNMPGTVDQYPNWRRKAPKRLDEIFEMKRFRELATLFADASRGCRRRAGKAG